jgi:nucleoside-diphosphate-sugar epimerase
VNAPSSLVVTGAGGWFGTALLHRLADPSRDAPAVVRVLAASPAEVHPILDALPGVEVVVGDVRSDADVGLLLDGLDRPDVVHAAGVIHPRRPEEFDEVNAGGTRRVVRAAVAAGTRRVVHLSSNSPFGLNPSPSDVFRDNEPYHPYLGYGRSKMQAELEVRAAVDGTSTSAVVLRPPWFYGPYGPARQTRFLRAVRLGRFPEPRDRRVRRSMVDVRSLADATLAALSMTGVGVQSYWVADRRPLSFGEILEAVREGAHAVGLPVERRRLPVPQWTTAVLRRADAALQARGRYIPEVHVLGELGASIACRADGAERDLDWVPVDDPVPGWADAFRWALERGEQP